MDIDCSLPNGDYESRISNSDDFENDSVDHAEDSLYTTCQAATDIAYSASEDDDNFIDIGAFAVYTAEGGIEKNDVDFRINTNSETIKEINKELLEVKALENNFDKEFLTKSAVEV